MRQVLLSMWSYNIKKTPKLYTSNMQGRRVNMTWQRKNGPNQNPIRKTLSSSALGVASGAYHLGSKALRNSHPFNSATCNTHILTRSLWPHFIPRSFFGRLFYGPTIPKSWGFHFTLGFIFSFMQWHTPPSGPVIHCLILVTFWNLYTSLQDLTLAFFIPIKPVPHG